jgi:PEGA domain
MSFALSRLIIDRNLDERAANMLKKVVAVVLMGIFSSACAANHASFMSEPPGAAVFVNGQPIGTTPCHLDYHCDAGSEYQVIIQKAGFEPVHRTLKADEVDQGARKTWLTAGLVWSPLWLGTLFTKKLKDSYEFVLKGLSPAITAKVDADQPQKF